MAALEAPIRERLLAAVRRVMDSGVYIQGPEVEAFEAAIALACGVRHGVGVSSGTDALVVALRILGIGPGDEVLVPAYSFVATATAVLLVGARPVFVDIDPGTFCIDPAACEAAVTPRTRAVIPVHLFGQCADMPALDAMARRHGLAVVEDAAQSLGAALADGRRAGSLGRLACVSFFPSKNLGALGDAGMLLTDDDALAERARQVRSHGSVRKSHWHELLGGNHRMDAIQAAVLRVKLECLDEWTAKRRENARRYRRLLRGVGLPAERGGVHVYNQFVIRSARRDELRAALTAAGVETAVYYPHPLPDQPVFGAVAGSFPRARDASRETLALPVAPTVDAAAVERVCAAIRSVVERP